ncbi:hypothetical protein [Micromonospora aurantiaca (nom. illeg.)]|uniref:hypothetical protein n=1 Tax=Micromonospora aurantiaca (nom. illeg.) TaxID=47850 RepID=UPI0033FB5E88
MRVVPADSTDAAVGSRRSRFVRLHSKDGGRARIVTARRVAVITPILRHDKDGGGRIRLARDDA